MASLTGFSISWPRSLTGPRVKYWKIALILVVWVTILSWHIRVLPSFDNPGIVGGYGATHDWGRFHIVDTGGSSDVPSGITEVSDRMTVRPDIAAYLLAITTIITGNTQLQSGIRFLQSVPNLAYFYVSLVGVLFYRDIKQYPDWRDTFALFSAGLFVSGVYLNFTANGMLYAGYGLCAFSLLLYIIFRLGKLGLDSRWLFIFILVTSVTASLYHTQALLAFYVVPAYFFLDFLIRSVTDRSLFGFSLSPPNYSKFSSLMLFLISSSLMTSIGMYYSNIVHELVVKLSWFFVLSPEKTESLTEAKSSLLISALRLNVDSFQLIGVFSKLILRFLLLLLILWAIYRVLSQNDIEYEGGFLLLILALYPIVLFMYYSYGGIGVGVRRTAAAGSPVLIMLFAYLLAKTSSPGAKSMLRYFTVVIIVLSLGTQVPVLMASNHYSGEQVATAEFTGENVPNDEFIFSEPSVATSLTYYDQRGIVFVRVIRSDWEGRLRSIYFSSNASRNRAAIENTISKQVRTPYQSRYGDPDHHYLLTSARLSDDGISLETLTYRENPPADFHESYEAEYNRIYTTDDEVLHVSKDNS